MQKETKPCKECGKNPYIVNRTKWLCQSCNFKRLHEGKEVWQVPKQGAIKIPKRRADVLNKDRETYRIVFETHPNKCEECNCDLPNIFETDGRVNAVFQFSHILGKRAFPEFRNNPKNFNRLCLKCHSRWEFSDKENMNIYESNMKIIEELKRERNDRKF